MYFNEKETVFKDIMLEVLRDKNQEICVYFLDGSMKVNRLLLHTLSAYKLEDKTDALILPHISLQDFKNLVDAIVKDRTLQIPMDIHKFWLQSERFEEICQLQTKLTNDENIALHENSANKETLENNQNNTHESNRKSSEEFVDRSEINVTGNVVLKSNQSTPALIENSKTPEKPKSVKRPRDRIQMNTTMKILEKNLNLKLHHCVQDNCNEIEDQDTFIDSKRKPPEPMPFVQSDFDTENLVPLESVLLHEEEEFNFRDCSVDVANLKVIIAGHEDLEDTEMELKDYHVNVNHHEDVLQVTSPTKNVREEALKVVHICNICDKQFGDKNTLKRHIKSMHSTEKKYSCDACDKTFALQNYLTQHIQNVHSEPRTWICDLCGTRLKSKRGIQTHLLIHQDGTKNIPCDECDKQFRHKSTLVKHKKRVHNMGQEAKLICDICNKFFNHSEGLKRHKMKIHSKVRQFQCKNCSKEFAFQYDLNRHNKLKSCLRKSYLQSRKKPDTRNVQIDNRDPLETPVSNELPSKARKEKLLAPKSAQKLPPEKILALKSTPNTSADLGENPPTERNLAPKSIPSLSSADMRQENLQNPQSSVAMIGIDTHQPNYHSYTDFIADIIDFAAEGI
eukprot:TRINITY_DN2472_c0_g1_i8.p1 TRINITY_DN2472_c0_g1~~TRINITY_DN2472_c0_g1_i8.p1  ORF type:complete len:622 (+),score=88.03 TRINITY_DN2472_c0_g1_i8:43-1908(+)